MTTNANQSAPMLDGLELEEPGIGAPGSMRAAVIATIRALDERDLLEPRHAAMCQLALELADSVTAGRRSGRASAAAMAAAQLRETLLALPSPAAADLKKQFADWIADLDKDDA